ncbi:hypothetical protein MMPV_000877 [Pyropia vietnamensis]
MKSQEQLAGPQGWLDSALWMSGASDSGGGFGGGLGRGHGPSEMGSMASLDWELGDWTADAEPAGAGGTHRWPAGSSTNGLNPGHSNPWDLKQPLASTLFRGKRARTDPQASSGSLSQWFLPGATAAAEALAGTAEAGLPPSQLPAVVAPPSNENVEVLPLSGTTSATTRGCASSAPASTRAVPRTETKASLSSVGGPVGARTGSALPNLAGWSANQTSGGSTPAPVPTSVAPRALPRRRSREGSPVQCDSRFSIITGASTGSNGLSDSTPKRSTPTPPHCRAYSSVAKRPRRELAPTSLPRAQSSSTALASTGAQTPSPTLVSPLAVAAAVSLPAKLRPSSAAQTQARPSDGRRQATVGSSGPPIPPSPAVAASGIAGEVTSAPREGVSPPPRAVSLPISAGTAVLSSIFFIWFARSRAALRAATDDTASAATAAAAAAAAVTGSTPYPPPPAPGAQVSLTLLATELTLYSNALTTLLPALVPWLPHPAVVEAYQMDATAHAASALGLVRLATVDAAGAFLAAHQLAVVVEAHAEKMSVHLLPLAGQMVDREALLSLAASVAPPPSVVPPTSSSPAAMRGFFPEMSRPNAPNAAGSEAVRAK